MINEHKYLVTEFTSLEGFKRLIERSHVATMDVIETEHGFVYFVFTLSFGFIVYKSPKKIESWTYEPKPSSKFTFESNPVKTFAMTLKQVVAYLNN